MPQFQNQVKIDIVPGGFTDMSECEFYCFRKSAYWQCNIILFLA
ncbi:hypothetical protein ECMP02155212_0491 [Escherichia coli MP021552.12]|nr:hypothetical protein ECMP02155212_0491 [Escherichia coli MP021552.12]